MRFLTLKEAQEMGRFQQAQTFTFGWVEAGTAGLAAFPRGLPHFRTLPYARLLQKAHSIHRSWIGNGNKTRPIIHTSSRANVNLAEMLGLWRRRRRPSLTAWVRVQGDVWNSSSPTFSGTCLSACLSNCLLFFSLLFYFCPLNNFSDSL